MIRFSASLVLCLVVAGCTKRAPEYYQIEADSSNLISRDGDAAYLDEEMDNILTRLRAIPPDTKEAPLAAALLATLEAERTRMKQERADAERPKDVPPPAPPPEFLKPALADVARADAGSPADAGAPGDAGLKVPAPYAGMPEAEFLKFYGNCVEAGAPLKLPLATEPGTTQVLKKNEDCEKALQAVGGARSYVFVDGKLSGQVDQVVTTKTTEKEKPRPAPAAVVDAGESLNMQIPGMPVDGAQPPPAP